MLPPGPVYVLVSVVALVATSVTTVLVGRRRSAPGATPLVALCVLLVVTVASQLLLNVPSPLRTVLAETTGLRLPGEYWVALALALGLPIDGLWLFFAVVYTGRGRRLRRQVAGVVAVLVLSCYLFAGYALVQADPTQPPAFALTAAFFNSLFFISSLASLGSLLVLEAALRRNNIPRREGLTLALGSVLFIYAPPVGANLDSPTVLPVLLFGAAVALAVAVSEYSLFETLPAARIAARDRLVEGLTEAVLLVDRQARVVDANPAAEQLFDGLRTDTQRQPLQDVVPDTLDPADLAATDAPSQLQTAHKRLEVTATEVAGEYSESVGYLIVGRDVTEQRRRERRLQLLTQFLAETIGERTATIARQADRLAEHGQDPSDETSTTTLAREIRRTTESLKQFVSTTRRIERSLSKHDGATSDLVAAAQQVATERANVSVAVESDPTAAVAVDSSVLRAVLELLVTGQFDLDSERVEMTVRSAPDTVATITLRSDQSGPSGTPNRHAGSSTRNATGERDETATPLLALCRLALERASGTIERADDGALHIRFRTGSTPDALSADSETDVSSTRNPAVSTHGEDDHL